MSRFTRPPRALKPRTHGEFQGDAQPKHEPEASWWNRIRLLVDQYGDTLKLAIAIAIPIYTLIRVVSIAQGDQTVMLEIVQRQGLSGFIQAAMTSVLGELAFVALLAMAIVVNSLWTAYRHGQGVTMFPSGIVLLLLVAVSILVSLGFVLVMPLTMVLWSFGVGLVVWWSLFARSGRVAPALALAVIFLLVAVVRPILAAPWMPAEQITWQSSPVRSEVGYVLGSSAGFVSVLTADDREIQMIRADDVLQRTVCRNPRWYVFDAPSLLRILSRNSTPECVAARVPTDFEDPGQLCLDEDGLVRSVVRDGEDCGDEDNDIVQVTIIDRPSGEQHCCDPCEPPTTGTTEPPTTTTTEISGSTTTWTTEPPTTTTTEISGPTTTETTQPPTTTTTEISEPTTTETTQPPTTTTTEISEPTTTETLHWPTLPECR